jgi:MinD superfamily P-loop ATPase
MSKESYKIAIASGKGGVGKSMLSSVLSVFFAEKRKIVAVDCDADAPNLHIWLGEIENWENNIPVKTSFKPEIDKEKCNGCGLCVEKCKFKALKLKDGKAEVDPLLCEGCGACEVLCPRGAIKMNPVQNGEIKIKKTKWGFPLVSSHLFPGETGSGKIVSEAKKEAEKIDSDLMIIDSAPGTGCPVTASLKDVDFVLLVTEPTLSGFSDMKRALDLVEYFGLDWGLVINKWDINNDMSREIEKFAKDNFFGNISYDKKIFESVSKLIPISETELKVKEEIKEIFNKLYAKTN